MATATRDGARCCCSRVTLSRGLAGLIAILLPSLLQAAHMQDSHKVLAPSHGLDSKAHGREHVLAPGGREVGSACAFGKGDPGVSSFRETHLGGRFYQELWGLAANVTVGAAESTAAQRSPESTLPGQPSAGRLVGTCGQGHPWLSFRFMLSPLMKPGTMQGPHQTAPWGQVWFQGNLEQQPGDSKFLLHSGNETI